MPRCFVAIELNDESRRALGEVARTLQGPESPWRAEKWVAQTNLHITVCFFGKITDEERSGLEVALCSIAAVTQPFDLKAIRLAATPRPERARILRLDWTDASNRCGTLAAEVARCAAGLGIHVDHRPYVPHTTICRARGNEGIATEVLDQANGLLTCMNLLMSVPSYTLYTSRLTPRGPIYSAIGTWQFRGAPAPRRAESARGAAGRH